LTSLNLYHAWYSIEEEYNQLTFVPAVGNAVTVNIPPGNYTYVDLSRTISDLYPHAYCFYLRSQNKFRFSFTQPHTIQFGDLSYRVLGFQSTEGQQVTTTQQGNNHIVFSTDVVKPPANEFVLQVTNLSIASPNLMTTPNGVNLSNFLASIAFNSRPFTYFTYINETEQFPLSVNQNEITSIDFLVTDFAGAPLTFLPHWTFTIKVDIVDNAQLAQNPMIDILDEIRNYSRDTFISQMIGDKLPNYVSLQDIVDDADLAA
jgi:hypothetical protein